MNDEIKVEYHGKMTTHECLIGDELVYITMDNDRTFASVRFGFAGVYTRKHWKILAQIEKEIAKLERGE
jgi:hypothetical protein